METTTRSYFYSSCVWRSLVRCLSSDKYRNSDFSERLLPDLFRHSAPMLGTTVEQVPAVYGGLGLFHAFHVKVDLGMRCLASTI